MELRRSKSHFIGASAMVLLGMVLVEFDLGFIGMGITLAGLILIIIGIYWASKPQTELPIDEMFKRINEKAASNGFWMLIGLTGVLVCVNHYFQNFLELHDVLEIIIIVGLYTFIISRFYYTRQGFS